MKWSEAEPQTRCAPLPHKGEGSAPRLRRYVEPKTRKPTPTITASGIAISAVVLAVICARSVHAQDVSFGDRLYHEKADCQFCHGVNGDGRGDPRSPGKASDLHKTRLDREQLIEVIACGRPGSEMPHFDKYAYEDKKCYGLTAAELGDKVPPDPHSTSLTQREIAALVDFIVTKFVGK